MANHASQATVAYRVRKATAADVDAVTRIWHTGWCDGHIGHVPPGLLPHRTEPQFRPRAEARLDSIWVAESDRGVVGFVSVKGDELEHLYVDRSARGTGVAAMLIHKGEAEIAAAGHARAWLAVVAGNQRARAFYARLGWRDAGPFTYMAETVAGVFPVPSHRYEIALDRNGDAQTARGSHLYSAGFARSGPVEIRRSADDKTGFSDTYAGGRSSNTRGDEM